MVLPAPHLDDRRFQDLVDDAKRLVQQHCPEWTDHNVSDPGVTLIEAFASMVDQLLYRLNRVPERHYVKFLDLIGVHLLPPTSAEAPVTLWLSAPQPTSVSIPAGTQVATARSETEEAINFTVVDHLDIVPCELAVAATSSEADARTITNQTTELQSRRRFPCFDDHPRPGNSFLIGLSEAVPRCAVVLRFDCAVEGRGVRPDWPPLVWEAWDGESWLTCEVDRDGTGGLNQPGDVVLHVPAGHRVATVAGERAGWLRCRIVEALEGQPAYSASPRVSRLEAHTIGGTTDAVHATLVTEEILGPSSGLPGQHFALRRRPVVRSADPPVLQVSSDQGWQDWRRVDGFSASGPDDRHFVLDEVGGEVLLGPMVVERDGTAHSYGAVPPGRRPAPRPLPQRRRAARQRGPGCHHPAQVVDPLHQPGGESPAGDPGRRRGGHRGGQGAGSHRAANGEPGRDR